MMIRWSSNNNGIISAKIFGFNEIVQFNLNIGNFLCSFSHRFSHFLGVSCPAIIKNKNFQFNKPSLILKKYLENTKYELCEMAKNHWKLVFERDLRQKLKLFFRISSIWIAIFKAKNSHAIATKNLVKSLIEPN